MNRAKPVDMRKALETVQALKDAGILFVPIPIMNEDVVLASFNAG